ncbi:MAG: hypothetical protein OHM77_08000 [Candidatus Nitricoxidivorans perseverans]|uniref:Uncharacterized protein n=1 Tax=Candidatus Nitricoxidivorans perseverans TaxID=2975601 RepID=A0AA49FJB9_9PROT|nr:MAG: hypothetical protein OHM77_08000 [Candidatus Nitricoxidivorans perseverans]
MNAPDIRWIRRLDHFSQAFLQLQEAVDLSLRADITDADVLDRIRRVGVGFYERAQHC